MTTKSRSTIRSTISFVTKYRRDLWLTLLTAIVAIALNTSDKTATRVSNDEHSTCIIQQRGLPAGHHLASLVSDIGMLLSLTPNNPHSTVPPIASQLLRDLKAQADAYSTIEQRQPATRTC